MSYLDLGSDNDLIVEPAHLKLKSIQMSFSRESKHTVAQSRMLHNTPPSSPTLSIPLHQKTASQPAGRKLNKHHLPPKPRTPPLENLPLHKPIPQPPGIPPPHALLKIVPRCPNGHGHPDRLLHEQIGGATRAPHPPGQLQHLPGQALRLPLQRDALPGAHAAHQAIRKHDAAEEGGVRLGPAVVLHGAFGGGAGGAQDLPVARAPGEEARAEFARPALQAGDVGGGRGARRAEELRHVPEGSRDVALGHDEVDDDLAAVADRVVFVFADDGEEQGLPRALFEKASLAVEEGLGHDGARVAHEQGAFEIRRVGFRGPQ